MLGWDLVENRVVIILYIGEIVCCMYNKDFFIFFVLNL